MKQNLSVIKGKGGFSLVGNPDQFVVRVGDSHHIHVVIPVQVDRTDECGSGQVACQNNSRIESAAVAGEHGNLTGSEVGHDQIQKTILVQIGQHRMIGFSDPARARDLLPEKVTQLRAGSLIYEHSDFIGALFQSHEIGVSVTVQIPHNGQERIGSPGQGIGGWRESPVLHVVHYAQLGILHRIENLRHTGSPIIIRCRHLNHSADVFLHSKVPEAFHQGRIQNRQIIQIQHLYLDSHLILPDSVAYADDQFIYIIGIEIIR